MTPITHRNRTIERLERENKMLREALEQFANYKPVPTKENYYHGKDAAYRDIAQQAAAALSRTGQEEEALNKKRAR